jgi:molybdate transport system regulatory protein
MQTLNVRQAADLLHLNTKRVQALAREGIPAVRVGRKWLFRRDQIEGLLGVRARGQASSAAISARNRLRGTIIELRIEGLMAEVQLRVGDQELVSVITRSSVERLGLQLGDEVFAVIKSTEVMIGKDEGPS